MKKIRYGLIGLSLMMVSATSAPAQVSISIGLPSVSIGINLPLYPELVLVPGYPVYYAPNLDTNYFFYDGMYWVYLNDNWYASTWYNGPWGIVGPEVVPLYILRIPVRYYRQPPLYFRGWQTNAPPRWGQRWGRDWENRRSGWNRWNRSSAPAAAPLPAYQRQYSGDRYPRVEQQHTLRSQQYRYQPRDKVVRQHFNQKPAQRVPAPSQRGKQETPQVRSQKQQDAPRSTPQQPQQRQQQQKQQEQQKQQQRQQQQKQQEQQHQQQQQRQQQQHQQAPKAHGQEQKPQDRGNSPEPVQDHGQGQKNNGERGQGRNR